MREPISEKPLIGGFLMVAGICSTFVTRVGWLRSCRLTQVTFLALGLMACWASLVAAADGAATVAVSQSEGPQSESIHIRKSIEVNADKAWLAIRGIGGLDRWFPVIATCRVEGAGVGATRILTLKPDGAEMRDTILEISDSSKRLRYQRVKSPFPISEYLGTVEVQPDGAARSILTWHVDIKVTPAHRQEMVALLNKAISDGVDGLEKDLKRP
jgi:hypothetical protein